MTDRRYRQYVPQDVDFLEEDGHRIYQRWDWAGVVVWRGFLAACQRSTTQGVLRWTSEDDAQSKMGLAAYRLPFTLAEFFAWTGQQRFAGNRRWTSTRTRHGIHKTVDNRWAERQPRRHESTKTDADTDGGYTKKAAENGVTVSSPVATSPKRPPNVPQTSAQNRSSEPTDTAPTSPHPTPPPDSEGKSGGGGDSPARASAAEPPKGSAASRSGRRRKNRPPTIPATAVPPPPPPAATDPPPAEPVLVSGNGHAASASASADGELPGEPFDVAAALAAAFKRPATAPPDGAEVPPPRIFDRAGFVAELLAGGEDPAKLARQAAERGWDPAALGLPAPPPEPAGPDPPLTPEAFA